MQSTAPLQAAARPPAPSQTSLRAELFDVVIPATGDPLASRVCREQADEVCNRWNAIPRDTDGLAEVMQTRLSRSDSLPPTRDEIRRICAEIRSGWTAKEERQRRAIPPATLAASRRPGRRDGSRPGLLKVCRIQHTLTGQPGCARKCLRFSRPKLTPERRIP